MDRFALLSSHLATWKTNRVRRCSTERKDEEMDNRRRPLDPHLAFAALSIHIYSDGEG